MQLLTPQFGLIIWTLLAFVIVFFILKKYAWKPILSSMNKREQGIADSLATAERIKTEMSQMKSEHEELLVKAREERGQMLRDAKETKQLPSAAKTLEIEQKAARTAIREKRFQTVKQLHREGVPILAIARRLKMSRNTVRHFLSRMRPRQQGLRIYIFK